MLMPAVARNNRHPVTTLDIAYTPDSDDAFNFYAWEHDRIRLDHCLARFHRDHIIALNHAAEQGIFDVVSVSSAIYPRLAEKYAILAVGTSVGRGYGPVLVSKRYTAIEQLRGRRIAVGGLPTTGAALAAMFVPSATLIEMRYDRIADAINSDEFDAGVMIHEELLFFPQKGLRKVADLGSLWCEQSGLPLPVGLNIVRRSLGPDVMRQIAETCRQSLCWAMDHFDEAFAFASQFGRGCAQQHVEMFSNADTLCMPSDVRAALRVMFDRVAEIGIGPRVDQIEVIDA